jgi:hypothetical protein
LTTFQQAIATILDKHNIQIVEAKEGRVYRPPNIPGYFVAPGHIG